MVNELGKKLAEIEKTQTIRKQSSLSNTNSPTRIGKKIQKVKKASCKTAMPRIVNDDNLNYDEKVAHEKQKGLLDTSKTIQSMLDELENIDAKIAAGIASTKKTTKPRIRNKQSSLEAENASLKALNNNLIVLNLPKPKFEVCTQTDWEWAQSQLNE